MDLDRPVFIWGVPRSGTHLLYDVLSLHPSLACPTTPQRAKKGLWGNMHWGEDTPPALRGRPAPHEGFDRFWLGAGIQYDSIGLFERSRLDPSLGARIRTRYADLRRGWAGSGTARYRVLDKCPTYLLMLDAIDAVFPDSLHVFLIRDPRAVLNSLLRVYRFPERGRGQIDELGFTTGVPPGHEAHRGESVVARLSWQIGALHALGDAHGARWPGRVFRVHYESLLADAHGTVEALFRDLGLTIWPSLRELVPRTFRGYDPPWPRPGEPTAVPFGKERCWEDGEVGQLEPVETLARALGYRAHRPGRLAADDPKGGPAPVSPPEEHAGAPRPRA